MKPLKELITALCFCGLSIFQACSLFYEPEPKNELEKLPPLTTTGENTFGCLVNGEAMAVINSFDQVAIYQGSKIQFGARFETSEIDRNITIVLLDPLEINTSYGLTNFPTHRAKFRQVINSTSCEYDYENTFDGFVGFSKIDRSNFIISGTFEFSSVTTECDTVHITDGRFDMQYIP